MQQSIRTATWPTARGGGISPACISLVSRCTKPPTPPGGAECDGVLFLREVRGLQYAEAGKKSKDGLAGRAALTSGTLYRIPYIGSSPSMAPECITWPRYDAGVF